MARLQLFFLQFTSDWRMNSGKVSEIQSNDHLLGATCRSHQKRVWRVTGRDTERSRPADGCVHCASFPLKKVSISFKSSLHEGFRFLMAEHTNLFCEGSEMGVSDITFRDITK
jgi:hypothetical protein